MAKTLLCFNNKYILNTHLISISSFCLMNKFSTSDEENLIVEIIIIIGNNYNAKRKERINITRAFQLIEITLFEIFKFIFGLLMPKTLF